MSKEITFKDALSIVEKNQRQEGRVSVKRSWSKMQLFGNSEQPLNMEL